MKKVYKITQSRLKEILMKEMGGGFLGDDPNFQGATYRDAPEPSTVVPERKINVEFTEKELTLLEDILNGVHPENNEEKDLLFSISHKLRDNLIKSK